MVLKLEAEPDGDAYRLRVSAHDLESGNPISTATYEGIAAEHLSGNVALVSHNSPQMEGPGYWFRDWQVGGTKVARHDERGCCARRGPRCPKDARRRAFFVVRC